MIFFFFFNDTATTEIYTLSLHDALPIFDRVERIIQLLGFVNSDPGFAEQPRVINGAVDLFVELYGERGLPTRTAIGCHGIFGDFPLEIVVTVLFSGPTVRPPLPLDGLPAVLVMGMSGCST